MVVTKVLLIILAYLIGSIPSAVWIGKRFYGVDVRDHGSGNAGFANAVRVLGWKGGIPVFIIDVLKGFTAVHLIWFTKVYTPDSYAFLNMQLALGISAVIGHLFPVYVHFKGGKGVATLLGVLLALTPIVTLICLGIFLLTLFLTRYFSLSSMLAGVSFPILIIFVFKVPEYSLIIFSLLMATLLIITHRKNIGRLFRKEESKANILKRRDRR